VKTPNKNKSDVTDEAYSSFDNFKSKLLTAMIDGEEDEVSKLLENAPTNGPFLNSEALSFSLTYNPGFDGSSPSQHMLHDKHQLLYSRSQ